MEKEESLQILQGVWVGDYVSNSEPKIIISGTTANRKTYEFNNVPGEMEWDADKKCWQIKVGFMQGVVWLEINHINSISVYSKNQLNEIPSSVEYLRSK